jgi:hypothetical protein
MSREDYHQSYLGTLIWSQWTRDKMQMIYVHSWCWDGGDSGHVSHKGPGARVPLELTAVQPFMLGAAGYHQYSCQYNSFDPLARL